MFRVLIVDDEPRSAEMIRSMLIIHFPVIAVSGIALGVKEAIEKLQLQPVDLVFLDTELNGQSGFELLDKLKNRKWQFITLSATRDHAYKTFEYGGSGYLLKPVNSEELAACLSNVLGKKFITEGTS